MEKSRYGRVTNMENRNRLSKLRCALFCFLAVFAWGIVAHGYAFSNLTLSHDAMNEFFLGGSINCFPMSVTEWKVSIGRFLEPVYILLLKGSLATPWLTGIWALVWIFLILTVLSRIFDLKSPLALILAAGILTVNLTVTAGAGGYMTDLDADLCAAFLSALSAFFLLGGGKKRLLAVPCLVLSLGLYQPMISVSLMSVLLYCLLSFLRGENAKETFFKGLSSTLIIAVSCGLYLLVARFLCAMTGIVPEETYNGLGAILNFKETSFFSALAATYKEAAGQLLFTVSPWGKTVSILLRCLILLLDAVLVIRAALRNKAKAAGLVWVLVCLLVMPLAMNAACLLGGGKSHMLMYYGVWMADLLPLLLLKEERGKAMSVTAAILLGAVLLSGVETANALYVRKEMERDAAGQTMTRVLDRLDRTEGYLPGETEVVFLGVPAPERIAAFGYTYRITGSAKTSPISNEPYYASFFSYLLPSDIRLCDEARRTEVRGQIDESALPAFPAEGSILWIDGSIVVKMR